MPLPAGVNVPLDTILLPLATRPAGVYVSDSFANLPVTDVELWVCVTEVDGAATVNCSMETSPDGDTWTPVPGSVVPQLGAPGSTTGNAPVPVSAYARATSTVAGTGAVTYRVLAIAVVTDQ